MTEAAGQAHPREIVVEEVFLHPPEVVWKALTTPALMARWFKMVAVGFEPEVGKRFTYKTTPAGDWDGTIQCEVIEVIPNERLVYTWKGGNVRNVGYGSLLNTIVTFILKRMDGGTRLRMVHSGFERPRNQSAYRSPWAMIWPRHVHTTGEQLCRTTDSRTIHPSCRRASGRRRTRNCLSKKRP